MVQLSTASPSNNLNVTESDPHNADIEESLYAREIKTVYKSLKRMLEQDEKDGNTVDAEKRRRISVEAELDRVKISLEAQIETLQTERKQALLY
ncbi:hypothetical protein BDQ12DRAFT_365014 [Crucibulum laeve]|uniref:Uncharacterized protein n=1 Tax=Crucibulum laeve TaxID=68775 RepID=A0A5C3LP52_9AGAR|nr:hypothetical protein BDQ12DRAFT_365014 [Crucibulum laeve]